MSIYEFALKMEEDGRNYYKELAKTCKDEWLKEIFEFLSLEETKHYNIFRGLMNKNMDINVNVESNLNKYTSIFERKSQTEFLKSLSKVQTNIYVTATEDEKKSISLYEKMLKEVETEEERKILLNIIEEEKKHLKFLEDLIELMNKLEKIEE